MQADPLPCVQYWERVAPLHGDPQDHDAASFPKPVRAAPGLFCAHPSHSCTHLILKIGDKLYTSQKQISHTHHIIPLAVFLTSTAICHVRSAVGRRGRAVAEICLQGNFRVTGYVAGGEGE